ncbi:hypothetical protein HanIR_Chr11g0560691 [Helianthus annuus]|nr:hypothetical protein HanIR_Chr11g0560691 [Helianthus annuus]
MFTRLRAHDRSNPKLSKSLKSSSRLVIWSSDNASTDVSRKLLINTCNSFKMDNQCGFERIFTP